MILEEQRFLPPLKEWVSALSIRMKKLTNLRSSQKQDQLEKAFNAGISFFLEYARTHFLETHYQSLLKEFDDITFSKGEWRMPKELINIIYRVAKQALKDQQLAPARDLFYLLSVITPEHFDVWVGLGLAYQELEQDQNAISAFEEAKKQMPNSLLPYLYSAESYFHLHDWKNGFKNCEEGAAFAASQQKIFQKRVQELKKQCAQKLQENTR